MKNSIILLILLSIGVFDSSQEIFNNNLKYEVNKVYAPLSISKETLKEANTLTDLNEHYKPSWVRTYISVEVVTIHNGKVKKAISKNDVLSQEQKSIMDKADIDSEIEINIQYIPENTLKNNDVKEHNFAFMFNPENEAEYIGGKEELKQYLKKTIDKIPNDLFKEYDLAALKFAINKNGEIVNPHVLETSKDKEIDNLLLKAISDMPNWKPAEYGNGTKVQQEFVLTVGNHKSCTINLLNIRRFNFKE